MSLCARRTWWAGGREPSGRWISGCGLRLRLLRQRQGAGLDAAQSAATNNQQGSGCEDRTLKPFASTVSHLATAITCFPLPLPPEALRAKDSASLIPPLYGALLKSEQDLHLFERLAFLNRRQG